MSFLELTERVLTEMESAEACVTSSLPGNAPAQEGEIATVKLTGTVVGDVWLARDAHAEEELNAEGLPIFLFEEIEKLRGKTANQLRAIANAKKVFPGSKVIR